MAKQDELTVKISADVSELKKGLAKANESLETLADKAGKAGDGVQKLGSKSKSAVMQTKALGVAVMGVEIAVSALSASTIVLVKNQIKSAKTAELWSRKLGIANTTFSQLSAAGAKFGLEAETVGDALKDLNVRITDAAGGAKAYEEIFVKIGLSTKELVKLSPEDQFYKVADAIANADENTRRWALDEINDSMFRLGPLMEQGSAKIIAMGKAAAKTGQALSAWEFKEIKKVNDALIDVQASTTVLGNALTIHLAPGIKLAAEWAEKLADAAADILGTSESAMRDRLKEINSELATMDDRFKQLPTGNKRTRGYTDDMRRYKEYIGLIQEKRKLDMAIASKSAATSGAGGSPSVTGGGGGGVDDTFQADAEARAVKIGLQAAADARQVYAANELIAKMEHDQMMAEAEEAGLLAAAEAKAAFAANELITKEESRQAELAAQQKFHDREFGGAKRQFDRMVALSKEGYRGRLRLGIEFLDNLQAATNGRSRKLFEITKAAKTGEAMISTYSAVTKALDNPFPLNLGFAAITAAAGAAQIAKIQSTQFGGGGGGGGGGVPSAPSASETGSGGGTENTTNFDVTLQGQSFSGEQIRGLIGAINSEVEDGAKLGAINVR